MHNLQQLINKGLKLKSVATRVNAAGDNGEFSRTINTSLDFLVLVGAALICIFAFNGNSFWIDEGYSAYLASQHGISGLVHALRSSDAGDLQTAGYYLYLWGWAHAFGVSEWALRASNLPFWAILCFSTWCVSLRLFHSRYIWLLCVIWPFGWIYVNEARVYLPLTAMATASVAALLFSQRATYSRQRRMYAVLCLLCLWTAIGLDVLGAFLVPGLLCIGMATKRSPKLFRDWGVCILATSPLFIGLGLYILWTTHQPQTMNYSHFNLLYVGLFVYDLIGLQGIGPDRNHLRLANNGFLSFHAFVPAIAAGAVIVVSIVLVSAARVKRERREGLTLWLGGLLSVASLAVVAAVLHERFLPRHAASIMPLFLIGFLALVPKNRFAMAALLLVAALWMTSDLRLAFDGAYAKDDFRAAAGLVKKISANEQARVLWAGDYLTACYYGLRLSDPISQLPDHLHPDPLAAATGWKLTGNGTYVSNLMPEQVSDVLRQDPRRAPVYLMITKPDLYDTHQAWAKVISACGQRVPFNAATFAVFLLRPWEVTTK